MPSVPVGDDDSHRVNTKFKGNLKISNVEGVTTLHELAQHAFKKYGHKNAMGEREYLGPHTPKVQKFGEVSWRTYDQVKEESLKFGASLRSAGLVAAPKKSTLDKLTTPCTLAIFENTCPEWMTAALGAYSQVHGASCFVVIYICLLLLLLFVFSTQFFIFSVVRPTPEY
jgi:long-chain acyl-CoA synthetase